MLITTKNWIINCLLQNPKACKRPSADIIEMESEQMVKEDKPVEVRKEKRMRQSLSPVFNI